MAYFQCEKGDLYKQKWGFISIRYEEAQKQGRPLMRKSDIQIFDELLRFPNSVPIHYNHHPFLQSPSEIFTRFPKKRQQLALLISRFSITNNHNKRFFLYEMLLQ